MSCDAVSIYVKVLFCLHYFLTKCGQVIVLVGVPALPVRVDANGIIVNTFDLVHLAYSLLVIRAGDLAGTAPRL